MRSSIARAAPVRAAPAAPRLQPSQGRRTLQVVAATVVNSNDFRNGTALEIEGVPYRVRSVLLGIGALGGHQGQGGPC